MNDPTDPQREALALLISAHRHGSEVAWDEDRRLADVILSSEWLRKVKAEVLEQAAGGLLNGTWPEGFFPGVAGAARELTETATNYRQEADRG